MDGQKFWKKSVRLAFLSLAAIALPAILLSSLGVLGAEKKPAQAEKKPAACTFKVAMPNSLQTNVVGAAAKIYWSTTGPACGPKVKLEYSPDGGKTWSPIAPAVDNNGEYPWKYPSQASSNALVKITDLSSPASTGQSEAFALLAKAPPAIKPSTPPAPAAPKPATPAPAACNLTLKTPKGGENWKAGDTAKITWAKDGSGCGAKAKLEYSLDGGATWSLIVEETNNNGEYAWKVPNQPSAKARVKVTDKANPKTSSPSAGNFTIAPPK
jgi:hypothetical protein